MPDQAAGDRTALGDLPLVPATEFFEAAGPDRGQADPPAPAWFADLREYRFCKAVSDAPLQPCSQYAQLAGVSSKTAIKLRRTLVAQGFIRERLVDSGGRGRSTILLELLEAGRTALAGYEAAKGGDS